MTLGTVVHEQMLWSVSNENSRVWLPSSLKLSYRTLKGWKAESTLASPGLKPRTSGVKAQYPVTQLLGFHGLNGYVNKQNCRIWSEANPQVYVETPLHPEKLTVWCALWAGGILLQKR
ncbi:hypothetical protein TNCV_96401 [Trichonephila clavipes]|nr:hypothetical protein TNCV_96401 [Trichonephila clavipes]